jgi:hypothetical protein
VRLVIREYLSMLRESGELDALLPDLLLSMGIEPLTRPGRGIRQFGVDIPAVGVDPDDGRVKLYVLTVKRGNISRTDWDGGPQSVRPSLNEILDSYLQTRLRPEHASLPKKIVLATGGELRPEVEPNWRDYIAANRARYPQLGEVEFDFWGGDKLALLIERYFMDEYLFPESAQKALRKSIALADQNEDEPRQFYSLIEEMLFNHAVPTERTAAAERQRQKALRLLNLSLNIVFHWCREVGNLRPALFCAERAVLRTWDWMRANQLLDNEPTRFEFERMFGSYLSIARAYEEKLRPFCLVRDGLFGHGGDEVEYPLRSFEVIGILATLVMSLVYAAAATSDEEIGRSYVDQAADVSNTLSALVANNPGAWSPAYDQHAIDLGLGLLALVMLGRNKAAAEWLDELCSRVVLAFQLGRGFPVSTDSFDDLVALHVSAESLSAEFKQKLMQLSTLLPMVAEWFAILDRGEQYGQLQKAASTFLSDINLQLWYPDGHTDEHLYRENAGHESGFSVASIELPETAEALRTQILEDLANPGQFDQLSCVSEGWPALGLIASRHFRTPVMPNYWRELVSANHTSTREPGEVVSESEGQPLQGQAAP